jgi:AcrR family transcriptional regulator
VSLTANLGLLAPVTAVNTAQTHAGELIYAKGVHATNNELLRRAAGVSGSQLNHYFPGKKSLVLPVIGWQADRVLTFVRSERFNNFESTGSLREWAGFYIA